MVLLLVWWQSQSGPLLAHLPFPEEKQITETPDGILIHVETPQPLELVLAADDRAHVLTRNFRPDTKEEMYQVWTAGAGDRSLNKTGEVRFPSGEVNGARLASDGKLWVVRINRGDGRPARTEIWRIDGNLLERQTPPLGIRAVLSDGRMLAVPGKGDGTLGIWESSAAGPSASYPLMVPGKAPGEHLAHHVSGDRTLRLLTRTGQQTFQIDQFDGNGGHETINLAAPSDSRVLNHAAFSADGRYVAMAFGGWPPSAILPGVGSPVNCFTRVWDVQDGKLVHELRRPAPVTLALIAPDNARLLLVEKERLSLWDLPERSCRWEFSGCASLKDAAFTRDGKRAAALGVAKKGGKPAVFWLRCD